MKKFLWSIGLGIFVYGICFYLLGKQLTSAIYAILAGSVFGGFWSVEWKKYGTFAKVMAEKTSLEGTKDNLWCLVCFGWGVVWWVVKSPFTTIFYFFKFGEDVIAVTAAFVVVALPIVIIWYEITLVSQIMDSTFSSSLFAFLQIWFFAAFFVVAISAPFLFLLLFFCFLDANGLLEEKQNHSKTYLHPSNPFEKWYTGWLVNDTRSLFSWIFYVLRIRTINALRLFCWVLKVIFWAPYKIMTFKTGAIVLSIMVFSLSHFLLCFTFDWFVGINYWLSLVVIDIFAVAFGRKVYPWVSVLEWKFPEFGELEHEPIHETVK